MSYLAPFVTEKFWHGFLAAGLFALWAMGAFPASAASSAPDPYTLDYGDSVTIRIIDWPGADGVVVVGADGTLDVPSVGSITAKGKTVREVTELIAQQIRTANKLAESPIVSASISKYRPFFILGYVQNPGEYDYEPALTVLKAISKAGGFYRRQPSSIEQLAREAIMARNDLQTQRLQAMRQKIRLARVDAELAGQETFDLPQSLAEIAGDPQAADLLNKERAILAANRSILQEKQNTKDRTVQLSHEEISALESQADAVSKQINLVEADKARLTGLSESKLITNSRMVEIELNSARLQESRRALLTLMVRSKQEINRAETLLQEYRAAEQKRMRDEQQDATLRLKEAELLQERSRRLILETEELGPAAILRARRQKGNFKALIERHADDRVVEIEAEDSAYIRPGDVIYVEEVAPLRSIATAGASAATTN